MKKGERTSRIDIHKTMVVSTISLAPLCLLNKKGRTGIPS